MPGAKLRQSSALLLIALAGCPGPRLAPYDVRPGVEVLLSDSLHLVSGKRVGLITNHTGISHSGNSSIDLLREHGVNLVALFAPEHGIRGAADPGERIASGVDERSGLPIHSLYGKTVKPTPEMLTGVDVLLFDIQDVGARYYTYVSTMALAMEAAGERRIPFVVLDRPNPIGGEQIQGNVLRPEHSSFVGLYPVAMRHGMTTGELAWLFNAEYGIAAQLHVIPAAGWRRAQWFDQTGLPWTPPSPNMPTLESAAHYPGTCLFEGTNLSVGRGTDAAFQLVGAPWLDSDVLAERLNAYSLPGVHFQPVSFTPKRPADGKFPGVALNGVRFIISDRASYDPTVSAVAALIEARRLSKARWRWRTEHFDRLAGTAGLREAIEAGATLDEVVSGWQEERSAFIRLRSRYLLY